MDSEKMGGLIKGQRIKKQMTQRELAEILHLSDRTISKWERGAGCPDISLLHSLAKALGVKTEQLLCGDLEITDDEGDITMILSDKRLRQLLREGQLSIEPLDEEIQLRPASVDVRLGNTFTVVEETSGGILTLDSEIPYKTITAESYLLLPGQFVLATTMEYFRLPDDLTAFVEGRSSVGRLGLFVQNAGWVDPGFEGEITLELFNAGRAAIELKAGRRIGQLVFAQLDQKAENPYRGKYYKQQGATGSRIYEDDELHG